LKWELQQSGLFVRSQVGLPLIYGEIEMDVGYRIDLLVEDQLIIEVKAVEALNDVHLAQVLTYLKLNDSKLGYLLNFNVALMKQGIRRVIHDYWNHKEHQDSTKTTKKSS
jgi:GxxExxY protein